MRRVLAAKLHGIHVTEANLHYHGSITLDPDHCHEAGILPMEFVEIWNKNSGARISTYVIFGARSSRCCVLYGAAARACQVGDQLIICSSSYVDEQRIVELKPKMLTFDRSNRVADRLTYSVTSDDAGRYGFEIIGQTGDVKVVALRTADRIEVVDGSGCKNEPRFGAGG
ncbi:aspartate 1-decarboxylase [Bradyrhizobium sp. 139]|jgi:aspartate 1-decarboxylase|uniref:aspartate 1-decarboxylase n=1 Tax=Bradyrhizobium sp. 139 TaxID=2782616 RepID=UPI001FFA584E|nr:aspartate 1-decarboxylase [Bradyrhizobium sp. 139]MCK1743455.1 aspartate 1-decarboxylase [Bradyrhizobium sp. 139]